MSKYLCIQEEPGVEGKRLTDSGHAIIRIPLALIRAGIKLRTLIPSDVARRLRNTLGRYGIESELHELVGKDLEQLTENPDALEMAIVHDGKEKVRIYIE